MKIQFSFLFAVLLSSALGFSQPISHATVEMTFGFQDVTTGKAIAPTQFTLNPADAGREEISFPNIKEGMSMRAAIPSGVYKATIFADGYLKMTAKVLVDANSSTSQIFNLSPLIKDARLEYQYIASKKISGFTFVSGFVVSEKGQPISLAKVSCHDVTAYSEADGYFEISIPFNGVDGQEEELSVEVKSYCKTSQTGILIWSEGDWQTIFKLKKKGLFRRCACRH